MATRLIAGCAFLYDSEYAWGDLFEEDGCYIFSAVAAQRTNLHDQILKGETLWMEGLPANGVRAIRCDAEWSLWDKHSVVVVPKKVCVLNGAAEAFIERTASNDAG